MLRRLREFRTNNTEDNTMLNFFDENEIHPIIINVEQDLSQTMDIIFNDVVDALGPPIGFEMSPEEREELMRCQEAAGRLNQEEEQIKKKVSGIK